MVILRYSITVVDPDQREEMMTMLVSRAQLGAAVAEARIKAGLTQLELAKRADLDAPPDGGRCDAGGSASALLPA
jgi:hypothetical protein